MIDTNAFAGVSNSTVQSKNYKKSSRRSQLVIRAAFRQYRNRFTVVFTYIRQFTRQNLQVLPVINLTLTHVELEVNLVTTVQAVINFHFIVGTRTFNNISVRCSQIIGIFSLIRCFRRHIGIVALLRVTMIRTRYLRRVRFNRTVQHARLNGLPMRATRVLDSQRFIIISSSSRVATLFNHVIRPLRHGNQARKSVTSGNSGVTSDTFTNNTTLRVTNFNGATNREGQDTNVTRRGKVVFTFRQVHRANRLVGAELIRMYFNTTNGRFIRMTLIQRIRGRAITKQIRRTIRYRDRLRRTGVQTSVPTVLFTMIRRHNTSFRT